MTESDNCCCTPSQWRRSREEWDSADTQTNMWIVCIHVANTRVTAESNALKQNPDKLLWVNKQTIKKLCSHYIWDQGCSWTSAFGYWRITSSFFLAFALGSAVKQLCMNPSPNCLTEHCSHVELLTPPSFNATICPCNIIEFSGCFQQMLNTNAHKEKKSI